ncbi:hypothetical protein SAMN05421503_0801 [Terribacillus aidingensis]|uniref:Uncharacterized protein n=1 Tax=Terribacillus aidingensis TaxID=586416 RepID=A0A285N7P7_9BACI|nr:hypothetical protein [Terribacillus aidingensis]SNZ04897.1 hypothetical protein SAMN05421503_0801 [Terribacillus aidingensis]
MKKKNDRILYTDAPDSLNFLQFVHNYAKQDARVFPSIPNNPWKVQEPKVLKPMLKKLWNETLLSLNPSTHMYSHEEDFQALFKDEQSFNSCVETFQSWWGNMAGQMAVGRFLGEQEHSSLYTFFLLTEKDNLAIYFTYDNEILGEGSVDGRIVLTLRETFVQEEMLRIVQERLI